MSQTFSTRTTEMLNADMNRNEKDAFLTNLF